MTAKQMRLALSLFTALVVISIAIAAARLTWRLAGDTRHPRTAAIVATAPPSPPADLEPILRLAPFGISPANQSVADNNSVAGLGLQLRGIMRARTPSASSALISTGGGPSKPFFVGESVVGGVVVDTIEMDHVVLRLNGRQEVLAFPVKSVTTAASASSDTSGVAAIRASIPASVSGLPPTSAPSSSPSG